MAYANRIVRLDEMAPSRLAANPANFRRHSDQQRAAWREAAERIGWVGAVIWNQRTGHLVDGHLRVEEALAAGEASVPVLVVDMAEDAEAAALLTFDALTGLAEIDQEALRALLDQAGQMGDELDAMLAGLVIPEPEATSQASDQVAHGSLAERFGVPPFSVLDARQGYWQERKRAWLALGIRSEVGRGEVMATGDLYAGECEYAGYRGPKHGPLTYSTGAPRHDETGAKIKEATGTGTSIFDPVLCELVYRWFCPPGGTVLDPFAGGSVRGLVAGRLGRHYVGVDLRAEQVAANREQAEAILAPGRARDLTPTCPVDALSPVQQHGQVWLKRDDLCEVAGVRGGKVRTCWVLAQGAEALVTAGSRSSPQVNIVAHVAAHLGIPARVHVPQGALAPEVVAADQAGAEVVQHPAGYNSVICARAREDAEQTGAREIPFGMECQEAITQTRRQVANLPECERLVVPVGSGMSLAGILWGLRDAGRANLPVLAVQVGADPQGRLDEYAPPGWRDQVTLVPAGVSYDTPVDAHVGLVRLDPHYEAKCARHLQPGDCLWVVGIRQTALEDQVDDVVPVWHVGDSQAVLPTLDLEADLVFTCPPYADLEVYSDDPADLSVIAADDYDAFRYAYRAIIGHAASRLRENRFAVCVVGDVRDPKGYYRDFVSSTIGAFEAAGCRLYNEAILVTSVGSLPLRAGRQFDIGRKLGKTHQNVLVFVKGDWRQAAQACGPAARGALLPEADE